MRSARTFTSISISPFHIDNNGTVSCCFMEFDGTVTICNSSVAKKRETGTCCPFDLREDEPCEGAYESYGVKTCPFLYLDEISLKVTLSDKKKIIKMWNKLITPQE